MNILTFPSGPFETNAYLLVIEAFKKAVIVDPAPRSFDPISSYLNRHHLQLDKILITHSHWDHIVDTSFFVHAYKAPVYVHELDAMNLQTPRSDGLPCWIPYESVKDLHYVKDNDIIDICNTKWQVIETPGHTPGGVCYYNSEHHILFSGDTLFKGSIGNLSFPTARPHLMWKSLEKIAKLPSFTKVYPGHGLETTIGAESWLSKAREIFDLND